MQQALISSANITISIRHPISFTSMISLLYPDATLGNCLSENNDFTVCCNDHGRHLLQQEHHTLAKGLTAQQCAIQLMNEVIRVFAERHHQHLALHAAAVVKNDLAIIIPAPSGYGKTSLAAWFIAQDYDYLTDELVLFTATENIFDAVYRPLNIKPSGLSAIQDLKKTKNNKLPTPSSATTIVWPAEKIGRRANPNSVHARLFIFPKFEANIALDIKRISPANAGLSLMRCNVNARNLPKQGFNLVTNLVKKIPSLGLTYGHFNQLNNLEKSIAKAREQHTAPSK